MIAPPSKHQLAVPGARARWSTRMFSLCPLLAHFVAVGLADVLGSVSVITLHFSLGDTLPPPATSRIRGDRSWNSASRAVATTDAPCVDAYSWPTPSTLLNFRAS